MLKPKIDLISNVKKGLSWRQELRDAIQTPCQLLRALDLPDSLLSGANRAQQDFKLRVPWPFVERMVKADLHDPLLQQVLPLEQELNHSPGFTHDPVGDLNSAHAQGLLHKYHGRVLLITTGACAIHCRYCFRRSFPYQEQNATRHQFKAALQYIGQHSEVEEVILSGGDPLILGTEGLRQLTTQLQEIPHIQRLRIHTRLPIVIPSRITDSLLQWTRELPWPLVVVFHINHAQEIDHQTQTALHRWRDAGAHLLNQTVLLRDINDTAQAQIDLSHTLLKAGVLPYYLHLLDKVQGSAHFEVKASHALAIMETLRRQLSGYLVPRLVKEQAGAPYKLPVL